ncbi:voltage-dependent calcium channel gamma-6 subunit [Syngnathoides biaculeatus]|uniref:voltage-dependent calcium channel gamma-6 subunit n=1 Tax=Syngnathoides biaculeatus TaxID=300417 RepID=UPI002ADE767B|nr:voltage-dependent calcium channel gamma-6 subunit [Syngnathoides biaculeatus]
MWNNFFVPQDEDGRVGMPAGGLAAMKGGRAQRRSQKMSDSQDGKIKLAFLLCVVGVTLTVLGVCTEFWVELAQPKNVGGNRTCQMAHYGLWKACVRTLWVADVDPERASCGPAELPGESNCTYFKFFTSGENAVIFKKTTNKNLNLAAAILALLSLTMMVTGSICILMTLSKGVSFFLKPASFCFVLSGILVLVSILMFHQSVLALLSSDHSIPLHHQLSWSTACVGSAGTILIFGGFLFVILSLPVRSCLPHKNNNT